MDSASYEPRGSCVINFNNKKYAVLILTATKDMFANQALFDLYGSHEYAKNHGYIPVALDHSPNNIQELSEI